jgi:hypothetical protein
LGHMDFFLVFWWKGSVRDRFGEGQLFDRIQSSARLGKRRRAKLITYVGVVT